MKRQEIVEYLNAVLMDEDIELSQFSYSSNGFNEIIDYNGFCVLNDEESDFGTIDEDGSERGDYDQVILELTQLRDSISTVLDIISSVGPPEIIESKEHTLDETLDIKVKIIDIVSKAIKDGVFDKAMSERGPSLTSCLQIVP